MKKIISIINQKGGVGKTTTAINLAASLGILEKKTLLIDFDPQANATTGLNDFDINNEFSIYDAITGNEKIVDIISNTSIEYMDFIKSDTNLVGCEVELVSLPNREKQLLKLINKVKKNYDYILLDCPPSLSLLTLNALVASNGALVPLQAEFYALEGLSQLLKTIEDIKNSVNHNLVLEGVIITMFDGRNNLSNQVEHDVRSYLGTEVFTTKIPRNIRLSEAPSHGIPALIYDHKCTGSAAYINLAREVLNKSGWVIK